MLDTSILDRSTAAKVRRAVQSAKDHHTPMPVRDVADQIVGYRHDAQRLSQVVHALCQGCINSGVVIDLQPVRH